MLLALAAAACSLALVWTYVVVAPMAFLDDEYARWTAKIRLLDACDLGDVVVLGDSRAAVAAAPLQIATPVTNLALAGTSPIETLAVVERMLRCPRPPRRVLLSLTPEGLASPGTFWDKSVRYRLIGWAELTALLRRSERLRDMTVFTSGDRDGLPPLLKIALHDSYFPSLYFGSLVQAAGFTRLARNERILRDVLEARGQYFFLDGLGRGLFVPAPEAGMTGFAVPPIFSAYMDILLDRLGQRGIPVDFVAMPVNQATGDALAPAFRAGLAGYLRGLAQRHSGFHLLGDALPAWPDRLFNDPLAHFNIAGTALFSRRLSRCLAASDAAVTTAPLADIPDCGSLLDTP